ncbi:MAG: hypothetical protein ACQESR_04790 [Planctomycetota bacterium]
MYRVFYILLTALALVACPFHCMSAVAGGRAPEEQVRARSCCAHCAAKENQLSRPGTPCSRGDGGEPSPQKCQCGNCLCRGATLDDDDVPLNANGDLVVPLAGDRASSVIATEAFRRPTADESPPGRPLSFGRAVRVLLQSFLL